MISVVVHHDDLGVLLVKGAPQPVGGQRSAGGEGPPPGEGHPPGRVLQGCPSGHPGSGWRPGNRTVACKPGLARGRPGQAMSPPDIRVSPAPAPRRCYPTIFRITHPGGGVSACTGHPDPQSGPLPRHPHRACPCPLSRPAPSARLSTSSAPRSRSHWRSQDNSLAQTQNRRLALAWKQPAEPAVIPV